MTSSKKEFLRRLADLCEQYKATFEYTSNDDGIHIELDGKEVFADFLFSDPANALRNAAIN